MNKRNANSSSSSLAVAVYVAAMRKEIEEEQREKYLKRIDYLVGANNELMAALERCESEIVTVEKDEGVSIDFDFSEGASADIAGGSGGDEKKRES